MTTTISDGVTTLHPKVWMQYVSDRDSNTREHTLLSGGIALTVAPATPRRVAVALLFNSEAESEACEQMHARPGILSITEEGRPTHSMQYAVVGTVRRELDPENAAVWIVTAEVREVGQ
ncbi:hypothetical protein [Leucobacter triazinivorans]|uniref:Uncharacterized protein n=1 Tax=Leucobacter triazinivorans TaxID=1784719 RepID=A0A4P6KEG7_9MICO|nr:hypothetical protein [Leucobacter triazinivorans]QBE48747.1 hypothetical protein EVS81_07810 [Leucobacter triazinivorans]